MAVTQAASGFGTLLKIEEDGNPGTFLTILEMVTIDGPAFSGEVIDATHHESPGGFREFLSGLKDAGSLSGTGNLVLDATQEQLINDLIAGTKRNFQLTMPVKPSARTWALTAIIVAFEQSQPVDDKMSFNFEIKISAQPTLT